MLSAWPNVMQGCLNVKRALLRLPQREQLKASKCMPDKHFEEDRSDNKQTGSYRNPLGYVNTHNAEDCVQGPAEDARKSACHELTPP